MGQNFPKALQPYYFGTHALFLETLRSREISKEQSICQTRLMWWEESVKDVTERAKPAREPVTRIIQEAVKNTPLNAKLLQRMINFQLYDIERGDIQTMKEMEVYGENTRSLLLYTNLHLLRIDSSEALLAASHLGRCLGICDILKKIPFYLAKHRCYIPTEVLLKVSSIAHSPHSTICTSRRSGTHAGRA